MHKLYTRFSLSLLIFLAAENSVHAQSSLAESLEHDAALQQATIIIMRSALGGRDTAAVVRRGGFFLDIQIYVETYRAMRNADTLANIQSRYSTAKADLLDPRFPATIEELVTILEML